ncbi:MAG: PPOX class F420-dependent oxidoreductase [Acidimicrobiales bacterium]|jgi:PPOX class probable F420-dependent enzyme|nr:PPOX class F420-dependent oxidoreductase [Acidimicrobiales bacterium]MDP6298606.1 PPOX class F420-dependent oxidoreductase [Acidimicrobiales bacterium]HJM28591.1 PPOX class F420-dependent oxidoreductase [Acidimicrobiales bacterium]HJM96957.1 PPOX class F420-dependent oxidoreductase [Acidimicrobiales bacterium]
MDINEAVNWAEDSHHGVLITLRKDGRPQSSDIAYAVIDGKFCISATSSRAKTINLLRDNRAVLHITSPKTWSYVSFDGTTEVTETAKNPNDDVCQELARVFTVIQKKDHPDWDEFNEAMIKDKRLVIRFIPGNTVGMIN